jgi:hypothetical protein
MSHISAIVQSKCGHGLNPRNRLGTACVVPQCGADGELAVIPEDLNQSAGAGWSPSTVPRGTLRTAAGAIVTIAEPHPPLEGGAAADRRERDAARSVWPRGGSGGEVRGCALCVGVYRSAQAV